MQQTIENRNSSYYSLSTKKQLENCLLPLWIYGESTEQELSSTLNVPINEITGRFTECSNLGLISTHPTNPSKLNFKTRKFTTNYILTEKGKDIVRNILSIKEVI